MGIEPFLVTASVNLILAQRLARRICSECKQPIDVPESALLDIQVKPNEVGSFQVFKGQGCPTCSETGYKGRVAVYEVMEFSEELKEFVINGASAAEIKAEAIRLDMETLRMAAVGKLKAGATTIEEVTRVSAAD
jgi:type IV pilus assembly protein PilB